MMATVTVTLGPRIYISDFPSDFRQTCACDILDLWPLHYVLTVGYIRLSIPYPAMKSRQESTTWLILF